MTDRLFYTLLEIAIFFGLVIGTLVVTKFGFDQLFRYLSIEPFSAEAYGYMTTVYSIFIAVMIHKVDSQYRKIATLHEKIARLGKKIIEVEDEEHHLKEGIVKVIS